MAALIDERFREIASWIEAITQTFDYAYLEENAIALFDSAVPIKPNDQRAISLAAVRSALSKSGVFQAAQQGGVAEALDVYALFKVLSSGKISSEEAELYLNQRYPGQRWSGGRFGDRASSQAAAAAADKSAQPKARKTRSTNPAGLADTARAPAGGSRSGPASGVNIGGIPLPIVDLPDAYDPEALRQSLESMANALLANDAAIATGQALKLNPGVLDGRVIRPGSLPPSSINPLEFARLLNQLPGTDQVVTIRAARSNDIDRWVVNGNNRGPGRVWQVQSVQYPKAWRPTPGPMRYRVVFPNLEFGIMGTELFGDTWALNSWYGQVELTYGIVLRGLPSFLGRPPVAISAVWEGVSPVALAYQRSDHNFATNPPWPLYGTTRLFHDRADALYHTTGFPFLTGYGSTSNSVPSSSDLADCDGFYFMLLSGRSAEEIYQQLNSRNSNSGAHLQKEAVGPFTSAPGWLRPRSPCSASVYQWSNVGTAATTTYTWRDETFNPATVNRIVQGVPFSYEDCDKLRQSAKDFSLLIQPALGHTITLTNAGQQWESPELWHADGVRTSLVDGRDWAIDIIVF